MANAAPRMAWPRLSSISASSQLTGRPEQPQREIHLARADQPADQAQREACRRAACPARRCLHGEVDRIRAAHQAATSRAGAPAQASRAHRAAEQAAPLHQIERDEDDRQHELAVTSGNDHRVMLVAGIGVPGRMRQREQRHAEQREHESARASAASC